MVWMMREYGSQPPKQDSEHFTLRMHHGGVFKGIRTRVYVGGTVTCFDFCDEDEISYMELVNMASEVGEFTTVDFYGMIFNGSMALIKGDADIVELCKIVGKNRVVDCYMITTLTEGLQTQESQACRSKGKTDKGKLVVADVVNVGVGGDDDTDDYDPDSTSSEDDDSDVDINDSDFDNDDDAMFDCNVDNDVEFIGLGRSEVTYDDAPVVDNLVNIDGDEDVVSDDELKSNDSNSDGEGGTDNGVKHTVFNENTDMVNPIFEVGMEFKTHAVFRDAVKEYAVKWGKEIKFLKSDRRQIRAKCKDGCPWDIYCAYVPNDSVYRVKTFKDVHSCVRSFNVKWVSTKWIVSHYSERIRKNPTWPIPSLVATIESEKTVNVHPQKAYRARRISVEMLEGSSAQQFSLLNSYAAEILKTNVGTTVKLKVKPVPGSESEVKFKRFYICWGALKKGFMGGCRPVIGLDGCHLKGPHGGQEQYNNQYQCNPKPKPCTSAKNKNATPTPYITPMRRNACAATNSKATPTPKTAPRRAKLPMVRKNATPTPHVGSQQSKATSSLTINSSVSNKGNSGRKVGSVTNSRALSNQKM
ncbi:hypothetical protein RHGRI_025890 [Rhododendron griersonianum]|uniref:Transposase MuDR plant domain-containing protein n=1 Tax=Rhododendron griersonianum TaxID=479676 RepID=A0AAV6IWU4_9ERIC|nr:hypothetical protein RHGRI_025890 [Rhododendron griersonianum]